MKDIRAPLKSLVVFLRKLESMHEIVSSDLEHELTELIEQTELLKSNYEAFVNNCEAAEEGAVDPADYEDDEDDEDDEEDPLDDTDDDE